MATCSRCGNYTNSVLNPICNNCKQLKATERNTEVMQNANYWSSINNIIAQDEVHKVENLISSLITQRTKGLPDSWAIKEISRSLYESSQWHYDIFNNFLAKKEAKKVNSLNKFINLMREKDYLNKSLVWKHIEEKESILSEARRSDKISEDDLNIELSNIEVKLNNYSKLINTFGIEKDNIVTHLGTIAFLVLILYFLVVLFTDYEFNKNWLFFFEIIVVGFVFFGELNIIVQEDKLSTREGEINRELFKKEILDFLNRVK